MPMPAVFPRGHEPVVWNPFFVAKPDVSASRAGPTSRVAPERQKRPRSFPRQVPMASSTSSLYDNRNEDGFVSLRTKRHRWIAAAVGILVAALALVWFLVGVPALASGDALHVAEWLSWTALFGVILALGIVGELSGPLDIRVCTDGVWTSRWRRVPVEEIRGSRVEETAGYILVRRPSRRVQRYWIHAQKRNLSNSMRFKAALEALMRK